jgi:SH3-like domain-containing protein
VLNGFAAAIPTATPTIIKPTVTLIPTPTSAPTFTPTPQVPDQIAIGGYVAVVNGVNFRTDSNTSAQIIRTLADGEVLEVTDGPSNDGNLIWWKLKDQNGTEGWAAQDYLKPTAPPR